MGRGLGANSWPHALCGAGSGSPLPSVTMKLAVVVPVYNEARWVRQSVARLRATPAPRAGRGLPEDPQCERTIYLVNDGSTDGTREILDELAREPGVVAHHHPANRGKGAAIRTGFGLALAQGAQIVIVHDADMEYDPEDHAAVLRPVLDGRADAVIGSRFIGHTHRVLYYWHYQANKLITTFCNMVTNLNLTDVECCLKAFTAPALRAATLTEERFGIEIELIAKLARARVPDAPLDAPAYPESAAPPLRRARVYEVAVSYAGRTYEEGKKIGWKDGVAALWCIVKHGLLGG